jgi:hypothetical protein
VEKRLPLRGREQRVLGSPERRRLSQVITEILVERGEDHVDLPVSRLRLRLADLDHAHAEVDSSARERALLRDPEPAERKGEFAPSSPARATLATSCEWNEAA